ncbi:RRQRL motif-containing zinc-binding protein [Streptomyces chartreusis]|uniref:RRQRL motif-containing zinc-binding protein n=1 Tax=Streptomyces chartreusis TaxID=1969 RepID=UPI0037F418DB
MPTMSMFFWDPEGKRFGLPTWPFGHPDGPDQEVLATFRQLKARGLRPGGQQAAGQIGWWIRGGYRFAVLYWVDQAKPKRPMTPAMWESIRKALAARRMCPECRQAKDYDISRKTGVCNDCDPDAPRESRPGDPVFAA